MIVRVVVKPNSKENKVTEQSDHLIVQTKEPADKNKANKAVIKLVSKHFNKQFRIKTGTTSKEKLLESID